MACEPYGVDVHQVRPCVRAGPLSDTAPQAYFTLRQGEEGTRPALSGLGRAGPRDGCFADANRSWRRARSTLLRVPPSAPSSGAASPKWGARPKPDADHHQAGQHEAAAEQLERAE